MKIDSFISIHRSYVESFIYGMFSFISVFILSCFFEHTYIHILTLVERNSIVHDI